MLCGDAGYEVAGGGTRGKVLGGPTGYRTRVQASELIVRCGANDASSEEDAPSSLPTLPKAPAPTQCVPGATQACVGPGGCSGGQACREDGAGFEPCDCGEQLPRTTAPAPAPAPSEPPAPPSAPPASEAPGGDAPAGGGWEEPRPPGEG